MKFFIGLRNGLIISIVLWGIIFLCVSAFADDEYYDYFVIKTTLKKISTIDGERIVPDVPCMLYSYVAVSEGRDVTYSKDLKLEGKEIMACVAVKHGDRDKIKHLLIGDRFEEVKATADYAKHFPLTIADQKRIYDDEGVLIEYEGADKDDPARFAMWCE